MAKPSPKTACLGPNAILQTIEVLDKNVGRNLRTVVLLQAGVEVPPPNAGMLPETDCAAVHDALRTLLPARAEGLLHDSGLATGDYLLRHRIPGAAKAALRLLPRPLAARVLARAIARNAWTFAGSGGFEVTGTDPLTFKVTGNPLVKGARADRPICHWHAAVFERLFTQLVWPNARVIETACAASGASCCCFEVHPVAVAWPQDAGTRRAA